MRYFVFFSVPAVNSRKIDAVINIRVLQAVPEESKWRLLL